MKLTEPTTPLNPCATRWDFLFVIRDICLNFYVLLWGNRSIGTNNGYLVKIFILKTAEAI